MKKSQVKRKSKIEYGQCYEYNDQVFMVVGGPFKTATGEIYYKVKNTLTQTQSNCFAKVLLTLHRPFNNWG